MTNDKAIPHNVTILGRRQIRLTGVTEVEAFNNEVVILHTTQGSLTLTGVDLNIVRLVTEAGDMDIEGQLISLAYSDDAGRGKKGKGLWSGLFR